MDIVESQNMSATITVSDNGKDVIVAYLNCSNLEPTAMIFNGITVNVTNKQLLTQANAVNTEGETPAQQYLKFETAVKTKAKSMGDRKSVV